MYENNARAREYDSPNMVYGFFAGAGVVAWVLCLAISALFLTGCGKGGTPTTPILPPNPNDYELLGVTHFLKDSQGKDTDMWARLPAEPNPPRGSTLPNGGGGSIAATVKVEVGIKNPGKNGAYLHGFFSHDGVTEDERTQISGGVGGEMGSPRILEATLWQATNRANYRYLLIVGTQGMLPQDKRTGTTSFLLDYR
ncbi:MAG: hypothetical protein A2606_02040 [Candidatus Yanofskybacteria bacterium RIFOXYD1_FULL_42_10]|uniref:Uncharacterized protein n=1 Tax=Candidatus Yanofskybacteria bacterium RIFOXYD1_FULL_42_10 TaxID=1802718 RepID=A0A1F8HUH4_9BACT|nr:MAG: hypothetical protein A2606_02040 [Candidatus Yanofskybacteria bacterium RIFOXYD1_FULL_42_10]